MSDIKNWVVTLATTDDAAQVASSLERAGFEVDQQLGEIGVITGRSNRQVAEQARALPGVADIAPESPIDIGPPGASDSW